MKTHKLKEWSLENACTILMVVMIIASTAYKFSHKKSVTPIDSRNSGDIGFDPHKDYNQRHSVTGKDSEFE